MKNEEKREKESIENGRDEWFSRREIVDGDKEQFKTETDNDYLKYVTKYEHGCTHGMELGTTMNDRRNGKDYENDYERESKVRHLEKEGCTDNVEVESNYEEQTFLTASGESNYDNDGGTPLSAKGKLESEGLDLLNDEEISAASTVKEVEVQDKDEVEDKLFAPAEEERKSNRIQDPVSQDNKTDIISKNTQNAKTQSNGSNKKRSLQATTENGLPNSPKETVQLSNLQEFSDEMTRNEIGENSEKPLVKSESLTLPDVGRLGSVIPLTGRKKSGNLDDNERKESIGEDGRHAGSRAEGRESYKRERPVRGAGNLNSSNYSNCSEVGRDRERFSQTSGPEEIRRQGRSEKVKRFVRPCSPSNFSNADEKVMVRQSKLTLDNPQAMLDDFLDDLHSKRYFSNPPDICDPATLMIRSSKQLKLSKRPKKSTTKPQLSGIHHHNTLGILMSPLYTPTVEEQWSRHEIAVFESGICVYGKRFHSIQKMIKTKSTKEVVAFFYVWKKTAAYKVWKRTWNS